MANLEKRDDLAEERYIEQVPSKSTNAAQSPENTALTRKILLKLDIRYTHLPSSIPPLKSTSKLTLYCLKNPPHPRPPIPLLISRPYKCRQRKNIRIGNNPQNDRLAIRYWTCCVLRYLYRQVLHFPNPQSPFSGCQGITILASI
jgi:hypothetical protein